MTMSFLLELTDKYSGPLYVYDTQKIACQYNRITNAFTKVKNPTVELRHESIIQYQYFKNF